MRGESGFILLRVISVDRERERIGWDGLVGHAAGWAITLC
jgi:hypothetical protein